MTSLASIVEKAAQAIRRSFSEHRAYSLLKMITTHHRIQGSPGMEEARDLIAEWLEGQGVPVERGEATHVDGYGVARLASWRLRGGSLELVKPRRELLHSTLESPLVVVGHSPPGEAEAHLIDVGRGIEEEKYRGAEGRIVISNGPLSLVYRRALRAGAAALIMYSARPPADAFPYMALFPTPEEAAGKGIPVVAVPRATARRLLRMLEKGEVIVRVRVDAEYGGEASFPYATAVIGEGPEEIHIVAHLCHPSPGANDNASGAAAVAELAATLSSLACRGELGRPGAALRFLWVPEYTGTLYYMARRGFDRVRGVVNLDMVGGRLEETGSALLVIGSPPYERSYLDLLARMAAGYLVFEGSTFGGVRGAPRVRFGFVDYDAGSDHDVYAVHGIPTLMINEWPDRYYHSSVDDADKIDPKTLKLAASLGGTVAYTAALLDDKLAAELAERLYNQALSEIHAAKSVEPSDSPRPGLLAWGYARALEHVAEQYGVSEARALAENLSKLAWRPSGRGRLVFKVLPPITRGWLRSRLGDEDLERLGRIYEEHRWAYAVVGVHLYRLASKGLGVGEIYEVLRTMYGRLERKVFDELLGLLSKAGVVGI